MPQILEIPLTDSCLLKQLTQPRTPHDYQPCALNAAPATPPPEIDRTSFNPTTIQLLRRTNQRIADKTGTSPELKLAVIRDLVHLDPNHPDQTLAPIHFTVLWNYKGTTIAGPLFATNVGSAMGSEYFRPWEKYTAAEHHLLTHRFSPESPQITVYGVPKRWYRHHSRRYDPDIASPTHTMLLRVTGGKYYRELITGTQSYGLYYEANGIGNDSVRRALPHDPNFEYAARQIMYVWYQATHGTTEDKNLPLLREQIHHLNTAIVHPFIPDEGNLLPAIRKLNDLDHFRHKVRLFRNKLHRHSVT